MSYDLTENTRDNDAMNEALRVLSSGGTVVVGGWHIVATVRRIRNARAYGADSRCRDRPRTLTEPCSEAKCIYCHRRPKGRTCGLPLRKGLRERSLP